MNSVTLNANRVIIEVVRGNTFTLPFSNANLGDFTTFTWESYVKNEDDTDAFTPVVTAIDASHGTVYLSSTNTLALASGKKYTIEVTFTSGSNITTIIEGDVVV